MADVARLAGVSTATVSRALRGLPNVSAQTRDRVLAAVAELDYVPSPSAASLASGRTRTVGVLTPWVSRWYFGQVIEGIERTLHAAHLDALLYQLDSERSSEPLRFDPSALHRRVDGLIVVGLPLEPRELDALEDLGYPIVGIGAAAPRHAHVRLDDVTTARRAVAHLADLGHRTIGLLTGSRDDNIAWSPGYQRRVGWRAELDSRGLEHGVDLESDGGFSMLGGRHAGHVLLRRRPDVTGVFAASDEMAMGLLLAARDLGLRVPEDLSVIGVDGHEMDEVTGLTTMAQDAQQQGEAAARLLLDLLAGRSVPSTHVYPTTLVVRTSTAAPRLASAPSRP
ncbi:LacI family DNA-binding transcriptional regulator [Cellulomonas citrea]|uniref:LacI family DNA-binding transcriptional regulator n=1 Tax=Cellulomonas citrea TaxID=1909423 RepID=UPI00135734CA|nr:LacI family DNA-binding transcriptional regulator [Cellulomonas citrea]